jgi:hypothetical protein
MFSDTKRVMFQASHLINKLQRQMAKAKMLSPATSGKPN